MYKFVYTDKRNGVQTGERLTIARQESPFTIYQEALTVKGREVQALTDLLDVTEVAAGRVFHNLESKISSLESELALSELRVKLLKPSGTHETAYCVIRVCPQVGRYVLTSDESLETCVQIVATEARGACPDCVYTIEAF